MPGIKEKYTDETMLKDINELIYVPEHFALCTVFDMGEIGTFRRESADLIMTEERLEQGRFFLQQISGISLFQCRLLLYICCFLQKKNRNLLY